MHGFLRICVITCMLVQVTVAVYPMPSSKNSQILANLFFRSRLISQDPAATVSCFSDYITKSKKLGETYARQYNRCLLDAKVERNSTETEIANKRVIIRETSQGVCQRLSACDSLNSTFEIFNCHAKIGANTTKAVYDISGNAFEYANAMQEKYRTIDMRHDQCSKSAERNYVEVTAANYRSLQNCLEGRGKFLPNITTTTATTTPTTTTSTTTSAPVSSIVQAQLSTEISTESTSLPDTKEFI